MPIATAANVLTIVLCCGILFQSWRMARMLARFRTTDYPHMVQGIQGAVEQAELVLDHLRTMLAHAAEPKLKAIADANRVADDLGVMIGLANAAADRLQELLPDTHFSQSDDGLAEPPPARPCATTFS